MPAVLATPIRNESRAGEREAVGLLMAHFFGEKARLEHRADGMPYVEGSDLYVSVSHGAGMAVLAVDSNPIGVDIERARAQLLRIAGKFLCPGDSADPNDIASLLRAWTAKEAAYKAASASGFDLSSLTVSKITVVDSDADSATAVLPAGDVFDISYHIVSSTVLLAVSR